MSQQNNADVHTAASPEPDTAAQATPEELDNPFVEEQSEGANLKRRKRSQRAPAAEVETQQAELDQAQAKAEESLWNAFLSSGGNGKISASE
ncbi:MAG: hypothetical protein R3F37_18805 [Candidatus Competibacteraceae bacterium]